MEKVTYIMKVRSVNLSPDVLMINGCRISQPQEQSDALADYYEELSTPTQKGSYNVQYLIEVQRDNAFLLQLLDNADKTEKLHTKMSMMRSTISTPRGHQIVRTWPQNTS